MSLMASRVTRRLPTQSVVCHSLRYPVPIRRVKAVLDGSERLNTAGLRTLDPADPNYKAQYFGDLRARDAAYHQGTVWAWLMGPFIDAWLKVYPADRQGAARFSTARAASPGGMHRHDQRDLRWQRAV
jgi:hypothetical protein